jgi:hypothetical protein
MMNALKTSVVPAIAGFVFLCVFGNMGSAQEVADQAFKPSVVSSDTAKETPEGSKASGAPAQLSRPACLTSRSGDQNERCGFHAD